MVMLAVIQDQRAMLIGVIEAGIREVLDLANAGGIGDGTLSQAHQRIEIEFVGVDSIDVAVDGDTWRVLVRRPRR